MTFYLVGLGLDINSISIEAERALRKCDKVFLETYTVDFPYELDELKKELAIEFEPVKREEVENESILDEAKEKNIALLVYGDPFSATTHHQLIISAKKQNIPTRVFHNASVMNAIAESGLSLYKFGKTSSMPRWTDSYKPISFLDYVSENKKIKAHSLILVDIGLEFSEALAQFIESVSLKELDVEGLIICSQIGTRGGKFYFRKFNDLENLTEIKKPFCFIIPSEMHFVEEEYLRLNSS